RSEPLLPKTSAHCSAKTTVRSTGRVLARAEAAYQGVGATCDAERVHTRLREVPPRWWHRVGERPPTPAGRASPTPNGESLYSSRRGSPTRRSGRRSEERRVGKEGRGGEARE